jgi:hypothetical protein
MTATQLAGALVAKGTVTVALTKPHDPGNYYQDRAGLYVYDDFHKRILGNANPIASADPATLRRFVLARDASGKEIEAELGTNQEFSETDVCWIIAEMIAKQPNGEPGDLDNSDDMANLFHTPSFVVGVGWDADDRGWDVNAWRRDVGRWGALGFSAFSRN